MVRRLLTQMLLNLCQTLTPKVTIASPTTTANRVHATTTTTPTITITKGMVPFFKFTTKLGTERYSHATRLDSSGCLHAVIVSSSFLPSLLPPSLSTKPIHQSFFFFFLLPSTKHKTNHFWWGLLSGASRSKTWKSLVDLIKGH